MFLKARKASLCLHKGQIKGKSFEDFSSGRDDFLSDAVTGD
jgi:hypothetical protein